jgi:alkanesulfonate monooxygenase SsuD/methylene tetrahydromethanopterin reductase-like flavin-dependent oxidoreductase (luciferase family)
VIRIDELPGGAASTVVTGDRDELAEQVLDWYDAFGEQGPAQDGS